MKTDIVTAESGTNNSIVATRIEPVKDPKINKVLFSLYEKLVKPLSLIETQVDRLNALNDEIEYNKDCTKSTLWRILRFWKYLAIPLFIINFIAGVIIESVASDELYYKIYFWLNKGLNLDLEAAIMFLAYPLLFLITIPTLIVIGVNIIHKLQNKKYQQEIDELVPAIGSEIKNIQDLVCFVPPKYRYSAAMEFFVDAYANSKVDNLKEAVNLYDTNNYREQMIQAQQATLEMMQSIAFNQLQQMDQLNKLEKDVWLSNIIF